MGQDAETRNPDAEIDLQDPLPEPRWLFRRLTMWIVSLALLGALAWIISIFANQNAIEPLRQVAHLLIYLLTWMMTIYFVAPSAEHVVKIVQAVTAIKSGAVFSKSAVAQNKGATIKAKATAGPQNPPTHDLQEKRAWER